MRTQDVIMDTIKDIMVIKFSFKGDIREESMNIPLTSAYFNLGGIQLYQLLMCIEDAFNIYIEPDDIVERGFYTLENIKKLVESKLYENIKLQNH